MAETDKSSKTTSFTRKKSSEDLSNLVFGKMPPQARDLEEAVLGALMLDKDAIADTVDILRPDSFYVDAHKKIYEAIIHLFHHNEPIDILTVTQQLKQNGQLEMVGGQYYITELTNRIASSANAEFHARIIAEKYIQRELIRISTQIINDAYEDTTDVFDLLDKAERELFSVTEQNLSRNSQNIDKLLTRAIEQIEKVKDQKDGLRGVPSGFNELDRMTSGWQESDLVIIAARPGMGKTAFTLSMARKAAGLDQPVAIFSLEMDSLSLVTRLISSETELSAEKLRNGNMEPYEWEQLSAKVGTLEDLKIFIDDTPALNIFELRAKCRRLKYQHNVQMFIIDYLQLMRGTMDKSGGNREQEISNISRSLKSIAKELKTPVIALSQLSREVEKRPGSKRPQLSDLRESGAIEQDADLVLFLYRPEYYGFDEDEQGNSTKGQAELIVAKHRNGATGTVRLRFIDKFAKFLNPDPADMNFFSQEKEDEIITRGSRMNELDNDPPF